MATWDVWLALAVWFALWLGIGLAVVYVGYLAYQARKAREQREIDERLEGPDPVEDLVQINDAMEGELAEARESLERTREAVRHGIRG